MKHQKPKGTVDILPDQVPVWHYIENTSRRVMETYGYREARTPLFEDFDLFARGVGESSDIVTKEMYDFYDKGDRHLALRPEGTASLVRAYVENKLYGPEYDKPVKVYYIGPMFRYERPQAGRTRQFHQVGAEAFGSSHPQTDVESIVMAMDIFENLGLKNIQLVINSIGDSATREAYRQALVDYLTPHKEELSEDSKTRLEKNPLRILDSKNPKDQEIVEEAPSILDYLSEDSRQHFNQVQGLLDEAGVAYTVDERMVRGLDYYTDTVFEIVYDDEDFGAQTALCGGGRYGQLVEEMGGPDTPAFGFAFGMERVILALENQGVSIPDDDSLDVYIVSIGDEEVDQYAFKLLTRLRRLGIRADKDFTNRKAKAQFKSADRLEAKYVFVVGGDEVENQTVSVKNLETGDQETLGIDALKNSSLIKELKEEK